MHEFSLKMHEFPPLFMNFETPPLSLKNLPLTRPPSWGPANTWPQHPRNCSFLYFKSTANRRQIDGKSTAPGFGPVHIERRPARSTRSTPGAFYFRLQRRNPRGPAGGPLSYFCHFLSFHSFLRSKTTSKRRQSDVKTTSTSKVRTRVLPSLNCVDGKTTSPFEGSLA